MLLTYPIQRSAQQLAYIEAVKQFARDIWTVDGPAVRAFGISLPTRMVVAKLSDGSLWINSPVSVSAVEIKALERIGPVKYLVAPTPMHLWRLADWAARFPEAQLWGMPGRHRTSHTNVLTDEPPAPWAHDLDQLVFRGNVFLDEVYFLHRTSRTAIVADFIQNYPARHGQPVLNAVLRLAGVLNGGVPIDIRLSFFAREAARRSLEKLLAWDFDRLIVAHGNCVDRDAKQFVQDAFRWLWKKEKR